MRSRIMGLAIRGGVMRGVSHRAAKDAALLAWLCVVAAFGCGGTSSQSAADAGEDAARDAAPDERVPSCASDAECTGDRMVCDLASGACVVACTASREPCPPDR